MRGAAKIILGAASILSIGSACHRPGAECYRDEDCDPCSACVDGVCRTSPLAEATNACASFRNMDGGSPSSFGDSASGDGRSSIDDADVGVPIADGSSGDASDAREAGAPDAFSMDAHPMDCGACTLNFRVRALTATACTAVLPEGTMAQPGSWNLMPTTSGLLSANGIYNLNYLSLTSTETIDLPPLPVLLDFATGKVYRPAYDPPPAGSITYLEEIDGATGNVVGRVRLSRPIPTGSISGAFSGYARIVLYLPTEQLLEILVPSGQVIDHGLIGLARLQCGGGDFTGIAEYFDDSLQLLFIRDPETFVRVRVADRTVTPAARFVWLSYMCDVNVWPIGRRWYFATGSNNQFRQVRDTNEATLGYCAAEFDAPGAITFRGTIPPLGSSTVSAPLIIGDGVPGSSIALFMNPRCTGAPAGTATVASDGSFRARVDVPVDMATKVFGYATAANGTRSICADGPTYMLDAQPPMFSGATFASATGTSISVEWNPAIDNLTRADSIAYDVCASTVHGGCLRMFTATDYVSGVGHPGIGGTVSGLAASTTYWLVVRARDQAGNRDANTVEVAATTGPSSTLPTFRMLSFDGTHCQSVDHGALTGIAGSYNEIATSTASVFFAGAASATPPDTVDQFSALDLSNGARVDELYDYVVSDLATDTAYAFADDSGNPLIGIGQASSLARLDPMTGLSMRDRIALSMPVDPSSAEGLFSGYGAVLVHTFANVLAIDLSSGVVSDLGPTPAIPRTGWCNGHGVHSGIAEYFGGRHYLVLPMPDMNALVRFRVPDGAISVITTLSIITNTCELAVSRSFGRWYWQGDGLNWYGGALGTQRVGFCAATFDQP